MRFNADGKLIFRLELVRNRIGMFAWPAMSLIRYFRINNLSPFAYNRS
jgi:hypothetical protein